MVASILPLWIIAREFDSDPGLLMVSQPTRGVDVGAMEFVHNTLVSARDKGAAVLLLSADLNEVMSLSDRLLVMYRGAVVAELTPADMTETAVGLAMAGVRPDPDAVAKAAVAHENVAAAPSSLKTMPRPYRGARPLHHAGAAVGAQAADRELPVVDLEAGRVGRALEAPLEPRP